MVALERILAQVRVQSTTSQKSTICNCNECRDTGWVETLNKTYKKCQCVIKAENERLWEDYGVNISKVKRINEYIPFDELTSKAKDKAVEYVLKFKEIKESENNWYALLGQPGCGKTHLVVAIGAALLNNGIGVVYMPYTEVMKEIKGNANNQEIYSKIINRYMKAPVLVIDDLFKDKMKNGRLVADLTEVDIRHIYPIINYRYYNSLPTIISSECTPELLMELDQAQGGRILERCTTKIVFRGEEYDHRVRHFIS